MVETFKSWDAKADTIHAQLELHIAAADRARKDRQAFAAVEVEWEALWNLPSLHDKSMELAELSSRCNALGIAVTRYGDTTVRLAEQIMDLHYDLIILHLRNLMLEPSEDRAFGRESLVRMQRGKALFSAWHDCVDNQSQWDLQSAKERGARRTARLPRKR